MINTTCCEFTDVFEITIDKVKKISETESLKTTESIEELTTTIKGELAESAKSLWIQGAQLFSFLMIDKLYKEDRLCKEKCEKIYFIMRDNFDKNLKNN